MMAIELKILDAIQNLHNPVLDTLMCWITKLGNVGAIWILLGIVLLLIPKTRKSGCIVLTALVLDVILCNGGLKHLVARVRPCEVNRDVVLLIARPTDYSFPSGHTAASFAAVTALYLTLYINNWSGGPILIAWENKLWKWVLVLAVLIAFSRLYLYVHYPTDILGGILVGIFCGYVANWCVNGCWRWGTNIRQNIKTGRLSE